MTPSLWPRPYSSPVSTTPCWRGSPPPGTKPDSGSYKANIYNLDIYNNFVQMLYVSLWWSALRVCNMCIPPGRDFLSHQGYLNAVSKSTIPVRVIVLWIVTNLQWYTQLSYLVTCSHRDGAVGQPWTDSPVPHCVRGQVPRPPGESTGTSHRSWGVPQIPDNRYITQVYVRLLTLSTQIPVINKGFLLILCKFSCVI